MNEDFETERGELGKIKHMRIATGEKILTACWQTTKIAHTLLIVLLTLIPRHSPGNETKFFSKLHLVRNQISFHCVFRVHYHVQSAVSLNFP